MERYQTLQRSLPTASCASWHATSLSKTLASLAFHDAERTVRHYLDEISILKIGLYYTILGGCRRERRRNALRFQTLDLRLQPFPILVPAQSLSDAVELWLHVLTV